MKSSPLVAVLGVLILSTQACVPIPGLSPSPTSTPPASSIPPSGYEPQPGDDKLTRDQAFLEVENSRVVIQESMPAQVSVIINGSLSDPCHQLRVVVTPANPQNEINLDAYSLFNPDQACITVIKGFSATIPIGSYAGGHYTVFVNGALVGEFDS